MIVYIYIDGEERVRISKERLVALEVDCVNEGRPVMEIDFDENQISWQDCDSKGIYYV